MNKPTFDNPREQAIWQHGRDYERERLIDALEVEKMNPDTSGQDHYAYRLGLRMAIEIAKKLGFLDVE